MEDARGKANILLELLLDPPAPGALFKDHLLIYFVLPKGVGGNQVGSGREKPGSSHTLTAAPRSPSSMTYLA